MTTIDQYGPLLRAAFAALHGGHPDEPPKSEATRSGESPADFLARTRAETLERLHGQLAGVSPPRRLRSVHNRLLRLLQAASEADQALAAQVDAYNRGDYDQSLRHSQRLSDLVADSARLDADFIRALQAAERAHRGTLATLGLADIVSPP